VNTDEYWAKMEEELERLAKENPPRQPWKPEEEEMLRKFWGKVAGIQLANTLGKSYDAVEHKARRMGLTS
jgi:hypothetical protein